MIDKHTPRLSSPVTTFGWCVHQRKRVSTRKELTIVNRRNHWLQVILGLGLLIMLAAGLIVIFLRVPAHVQTEQASTTAVELAQAPIKDLPVPTAMIIGTIYPTETPLPTVPPPPTPTLLPGPTVTPLALLKSAADASGSVIYALMEIKQAVAISSVFSVSVDSKGTPQGKPIQIYNDLLRSAIQMHFAPDGSRIVLNDGWSLNSVLYLESGKLKSIFQETSNPMGHFFDWYPDSRQVLIGTMQGSKDIGLWLADTDTGKHVTLHAEYPSSSVIGGAVSPDGQKVIYALKPGWDTPAEIWMADANGGNQRHLYTSDNALGYVAAFTWSPDGNKIAFLGDGIMVMGADEKIPHPLGKSAVMNFDFRPVWSPDGRKLAYITYEPSASSVVSEKKDLTLAEQQMQAFSNTNIHWIDVVTGEEHTLITDGSTGNIDPAWSPDGSQLAFAAFQKGTGEIKLINADGTNLRAIAHANQPMRFPFWRRAQSLQSVQP